jgi:endoglucanase
MNLMSNFLNHGAIYKLATPFISGLVVTALALVGTHVVNTSSLYHSAIAETGAVASDGSGSETTNTPYTATMTTPTTILANASSTFSASFGAIPDQSNLIIDAEIYNSAGQRVFQYTQADQTLSSTPTTYTWTWKPTITDIYTIKLGIFSAHWSNTLDWNSSAATFNIVTDNTAAPTTQMPSTTASSTTTTAASQNTPGISGPAWHTLPFYTDPNNDATNYATANPNVSQVSLIEREGQTPVADWFGGWNSDVKTAASSYVTAAASANATPVLILYNIPDRDCGGYSAGGAEDENTYLSWVQQVADGIGNNPAVVILEPDALAGLDCLSTTDQQTRYAELSQAVAILKANTNTYVYLDAGHPGWQTPAVMAKRLQAADIAGADGFSLNVSNFVSTAANETYGDQISSLVDGKHYVIDTSRNGNGASSDGEWCNPSGMALGQQPTTDTNDSLVDAYIWAKGPWGSDGPCNGGPAAGQDFWSYAIQLAENAGW